MVFPLNIDWENPDMTITVITDNSKEPNMNQTYAYIDSDGTITKLTEEQQEHFKKVVEYCKEYGLEEQLEEATHIDANNDLELSLTKFVDDNEVYFDPVYDNRWEVLESFEDKSALYQKPNIMITEHSSDYKASLTSGETLHDAVVDFDLYSKDSDNTFPDFPFYVKDTKRNRQWLKDNGCMWANGDDLPELPQRYIDTGNLYVYYKEVYTGGDEETGFKHLDTHLSVTSWSLSESEKKRQEKLDSISEKEQTINQLKEQMKELEKDVNTLKESL